MEKTIDYKKYLVYLIVISIVIRSFFAVFLELTNDEVGYWTYALFPSLSYFDHPPLVGWLIRITTLNLTLPYEFFVRLSSIIFGAINTYLIFRIGEVIKDKNSGLIAALMYNASIYCFLITGIFIMPDTPQILFWLLSIYYFINVIKSADTDKFSRKSLLIAGIFVGLALISKYHSIFVWFGFLLYILIYDRKWFRTKELYFSLLISIIIFLPVLIWNYQNNFISFTFQGERVDILKSGIRIDFFFTELFGEIFYNNPIIFFLVLFSLIGFRKINLENNNFKKLLLLIGLPNILTFLIFSLFRRTLPHWTGPGYVTLIILSAMYISQKKQSFRIPASVITAICLLIIILILGYFQINFSLFARKVDNNVLSNKVGVNDLTLDMYGWRQIKKKFIELDKKYVEKNKISKEAPIISNKWYNSGHIDFYIGNALNKDVYCTGNINDIRNYLFVNKARSGIKIGEDAYYISPSRDFKDPNEILSSNFNSIMSLDTIRVKKGEDIVENVFIYKLKGFTGKRFY